MAATTHSTTGIVDHTHNNIRKPHEIIPDQLLRLRVISAKLPNLKRDANTYCVVAIGKQAARTKVVKDTNEPVFEENFAIGYEIQDLESEIVIDVFEKNLLLDDRVGEFRIRLGQVDPPKLRKNRAKGDTPQVDKKTTTKGINWANAIPQEAALIDRKGENVGVLNILMRREVRLHGIINVTVRELIFNTNDLPNKPTKIVMKLGQERTQTEVVVPQLSATEARFAFNLSQQFNVNDQNNISDLFFELWQEDVPLAEGRLTLFDARKKRFDGNITLIAPFGHEVNQANIRKQVAQLKIASKFTETTPARDNITSANNTNNNSA